MTCGTLNPVAGRDWKAGRDKSAGRHIPTKFTDTPPGVSGLTHIPEDNKSSGVPLSVLPC